MADFKWIQIRRVCSLPENFLICRSLIDWRCLLLAGGCARSPAGPGWAQEGGREPTLAGGHPQVGFYAYILIFYALVAYILHFFNSCLFSQCICFCGSQYLPGDNFPFSPAKWTPPPSHTKEWIWLWHNFFKIGAKHVISQFLGGFSWRSRLFFYLHEKPLEMADKGFCQHKKNYVTHFQNQRCINSYYIL